MTQDAMKQFPISDHQSDASETAAVVVPRTTSKDSAAELARGIVQAHMEDWGAEPSRVKEQLISRITKALTDRTAELEREWDQWKSLAKDRGEILSDAIANMKEWEARAEAAEATVAKLREEQRLFDEVAADRQRTLDRIADLIGLPNNAELTQTEFELWWDRQALATTPAVPTRNEDINSRYMTQEEIDAQTSLIRAPPTPPDEARVGLFAWIDDIERHGSIDTAFALDLKRKIAALPAAPALDGEVVAALRDLSQAREILNAVACGFWTENQTELSSSMASHAGQAIELLDSAASYLQPSGTSGDAK
jgi:hypothetical protein